MVNHKAIALALAATTLTAVYILSASPNTFGSSISNAELLAISKYSKSSYCDQGPVAEWKCGSDCEYHNKMTSVQVFTDSVMKSQSYCAYNPSRKEIVVAFRGTSNMKNWISDFKAFPVDFPRCSNCKIHKGFRDSLDPLMPKINTCVVNLAKTYPDAPIIVTGHSLGGAMAVLQISELRSILPYKTIKLVTFGSPRVGNSAFAYYMNLNFPNQARVVSANDIVPHVPFLNLGFVHSGPELWFKDLKSPWVKQVCEVTDYSKENESCSDSVWSIFYSAKDHLSYLGDYTGCSFSKSNALSEGIEIEETLKPIIDERIRHDEAEYYALTNGFTSD